MMLKLKPWMNSLDKVLILARSLLFGYALLPACELRLLRPRVCFVMLATCYNILSRLVTEVHLLLSVRAFCAGRLWRIW